MGDVRSGEPVPFDLRSGEGWYDFQFTVEGRDAFSIRYAGHIETGRESFSDPLIGRRPV